MRHTIVVAIAMATAAANGYPSGGATASIAGGPKIGYELTARGVVQEPGLAQAVEAHLAAAAGAVDPTAVVSEGCEDVTFCVSVIAAPVRVGRREGGLAVASYVTRRLVAHPQWPWAPPAPEEEPSSPVVIENAFTVGGKAECAPCQRALEDLHRTVGTVEEITRETMVDEGDLNLAVGPADRAFVGEVAAGLAKRFVDGHLRPWLAQERAIGSARR